MQIFMPYESITDSLNCLDNKRLGKQRVEAYQILKIVANYGQYNGPYKNHPAVLMCVNYVNWIRRYYNMSLRIWSDRGFKNIKLQHDYNITYNIITDIYNPMLWSMEPQNNCPIWIGDVKFHQSHQSNLVRKKPSHYKLYFPDVPNNLPYYWPIDKRNFKIII